MHFSARTCAPFCIALLVSCAAPDEEAQPSKRKADILFVIEPEVMVAEAVALADGTNTAAWQQLGEALDYRIGITSTSASYEYGASEGVERGEAGWTYAPMIDAGADSGVLFQKQLACEATCWGNVAADPAFVCPADEPLPGISSTTAISVQFLDCLCGGRAWRSNCGVGGMGIEASFLALCRAVDDPPEACVEFPEDAPEGFTLADRNTNDGLLRDDATTIMVVMSKEGDESPRNDGVGSASVQQYVDLLQEFPNPVRFAVLGPAWSDGDNRCIASDAVPWKLERYQNIAETTSGSYIDLTYLNAACEPRPFVTELLSTLPDLVSM